MEAVVQLIQLLFTILLILLLVRLLLLALRSNRSNPIVSTIFSSTEPIVRPFHGIVRAERQELVATFLALLAVLILQYIVLELLRALNGLQPRERDK